MALSPLDRKRADVTALEAAMAVPKFDRLSLAAGELNEARNRKMPRELSDASSEFSDDKRRSVRPDSVAAMALSVEAQLKLVQSLAREKRVMDAMRLADDAESSVRGVVPANVELLAAVWELTSFEELDSSAALRSAVIRSDRVLHHLSQSDDRLCEAVR